MKKTRMTYNEIEEMVVDVNVNGKKTGFEFEVSYCPECGSNQYDPDTCFCYTCMEQTALS